MGSYRKVRIETELLKQISMLILQGKIKDPMISNSAFITVTRVDLAADLSMAKVYVSFLGSMITSEDEADAKDPAELEKEQQRTLAGLKRATGFIQHELGKAIRLRRIPELKFVLDETIKEGDMMVDTIDSLNPEEEAGLGAQTDSAN